MSSIRQKVRNLATGLGLESDEDKKKRLEKEAKEKKEREERLKKNPPVDPAAAKQFQKGYRSVQ